MSGLNASSLLHGFLFYSYSRILKQNEANGKNKEFYCGKPWNAN